MLLQCSMRFQILIASRVSPLIGLNLAKFLTLQGSTGIDYDLAWIQIF